MWIMRIIRLARMALLLVAVVAASPAVAQTELPSEIPIFPLQDIMLFPGVPRPLHIFEPRYREMLADALEGDRVIGMVMLQPGHESEYFGRPPIFEIGCAGVLGAVEELPDGRYNIILHGTTKFRVTSEDETHAYRLAQVEPLEETMDEAERRALRELRPRLVQPFQDIANREPTPTPPTPTPTPTPEELPDEALVNGLAQFFDMEPLERLELLKKANPLERAEALIEIARRNNAVAMSRRKEEATCQESVREDL